MSGSRLRAIKSTLPLPVQRRLTATKSRIERGAGKTRYHAAVVRKAPLDKQVARMVLPSRLTTTWWVELEHITLQTRHHKWKHAGARLSVDGAWDIENTRPRMSIFDPVPEDDPWWSDFETVRAIFLHDQDYRATPQYGKLMEAVEEGRSKRGCRSVADVHAYFERLMGTFASMQRDGYLSQEELGSSSRDEMLLHVTRGGQLCYGGTAGHRIGMAEILGIRWVPFYFKHMHPDWVELVSQRSGLPPHQAVIAWVTNDERFRERHPDRAG